MNIGGISVEELQRKENLECSDVVGIRVLNQVFRETGCEDANFVRSVQERVRWWNLLTASVPSI